jgi:hypothetical protein
VEHDKIEVFHIINENEQPTWASLLEWLQREEQFEILSPAQWVERLETMADRGSCHPALRLLDHWKKAYQQSEDGTPARAQTGGRKGFAMGRTKEAVPILRDIHPVDESYFARLWIWIRNKV